MERRIFSSPDATSLTAPSTTWLSASIPQAEVTICGAWMVSSLSKITWVTSSPMITVEPFTPWALVTTAPTVTSAPVPAVEGTEIMGSVLFGTIKNLSNSALVLMCGIFTPAAIILQVSSTEPPPNAITHSAWHACAALRPASISAMVGSELMSANRVQPTPALSSDCMMACS